MEMFKYFENKTTFESKLSADVVKDTDICFIEDTQEIWTHGSYYNKAGDVLYEVSPTSANFGTVTLSDSLANYKEIEIFAVTDDYHALYQRVPNPDGMDVSFNAALVGQSNYFTKCKVYRCSGTTISTATIAGTGTDSGTQVKMAGLWGTHASTSFSRGDSYVGIYKVVGYK